MKLKRMLPLFLAITLLFGLLQGCVTKQKSLGEPLSPAVSVLSQEREIALWGLAGETQILDAECFLRGLNLSKLGALRINSLPDRTVGSLVYEEKQVEAGWTFSPEELSRLLFEPTSGKAGSTSFSFEINDCGVEYICRLYCLREVNASPSLAGFPTLLQKLSVYKNSVRTGAFFAEDPEDDPITFEIVSYPQYGSISVSQNKYLYQPFRNYTGSDSFSFVAKDCYGNYSASLKISIGVTGEGADLVFADVADQETESALRTLASCGILGGTEVGNTTYFYPERPMTRIDFLVSAMSAAGMTDLPVCSDTGFADDDKIPASMKAYVSAAYRLGYLEGKVKDGEVLFAPTDPITLGEAASLLEHLLLPDKGSVAVATAETVSDRVKDAICALASIGVIDAFGEVYPTNDILTRGEAAKLLEKVFFLTGCKKF